MEYDCKHDTDIVSNWQTDLAAALEHERPVMTAALAASYNAADVGYTLTMQPWMAHESQASFSERCGRETNEAHEAEVLLQTQNYYKGGASRRRSVPAAFDSRTNWPIC